MKNMTLHRRKSVVMVTLGIAFASLAMSGLARAGCPVPASALTHGTSAKFVPAVFMASDPAFGSLMISDGESTEHAAIVGLWEFEQISMSTPTNINPMPDGTLIDFGTAAWHSDGTELMNSGARNPADGDFCQGVWTRVGRRTFALRHIALAYAGGSYLGPAIIKELVTVDKSGDHFSGTFQITQYLASMTQGHEFDQTTILVNITGNMTGVRF